MPLLGSVSQQKHRKIQIQKVQTLSPTESESQGRDLQSAISPAPWGLQCILVFEHPAIRDKAIIHLDSKIHALQ